MDTDFKPRRQVNYEQMNSLLEFLQEHVGLAKGLTRGRRGKLHSLDLWKQCAKKLNPIKDGAMKDGKGWSKTKKMVRNYVRKRKGPEWSKCKLDEAVEAVKSGRLSGYKAATLFKIPRSTIMCHVHAIRGQKSDHMGRPTALSAEDEQKLVNCLHLMEKNGVGLSRTEIIDLVQSFVKANRLITPFKDGKPGLEWFKNFCSRHNLSINKSQSVEYWCDWKYRVRRKALELKAAKDNNKPPPEDIVPLSHMEESILELIGGNAVDGVVIKSDPLAEGAASSEEEEALNDETNEDSTSANQYYGTRSKPSRGLKRGRSSRESDLGDGGPSSPVERKPRVGAASYGDADDSDHNNDDASAFLRLEKKNLENSRRIQDTLQTISTELTRLVDVMSDIRDALIDNKVNLLQK